MDDLNSPIEDMEEPVTLRLSELVPPPMYELYKLFLQNSTYFQGEKFKLLIKTVAECAYNRAIEDKDATPIIEDEEEESPDNVVDIPIDRNRDNLIAEALSHVQNMNEGETEEC